MTDKMQKILDLIAEYSRFLKQNQIKLFDWNNFVQL